MKLACANCFVHVSVFCNSLSEECIPKPHTLFSRVVYSTPTPTHAYICTITKYIATEIIPERDVKTRVWDVMYPSKLELLSGKHSGRLLKYDPYTDTTTVLLKGLLFANGISVDPNNNEDYIIFTESYSIRVGKYYLTGEKSGTVEYIVDGAPLPACKLPVLVGILWKDD